MITMSDFTTEQLKAIVGMGMVPIKEELKERLKLENNIKFPISIGDYFFDEYEKCIYHITNVTYDRINFEFIRVHEESIIGTSNSYADRNSHNFDSMIRIDKEKFDAIQKIAKNYKTEIQELRLSAIKSANDIFCNIK